MAAPPLREGSLVAVGELRGRAARRAATGEACDVSGSSGQILELDGGGEECLLLTFEGVQARVGTAGLSSLRPEALRGADFVVGPRCDLGVFGQGAIDELVSKGYVVTRLLADEADVSKIHAVTGQISFDRVPSEIEPHYLGRDSREKTALLDLRSPAGVPEAVASALAAAEARFDELLELLAPLLDEHLGIRVASRSELLVRQTFVDAEEEARYPSRAELNGEERVYFRTLLKRRRVCLLHFLGPAAGSLTLIPRDAGGAGELEIQALPGTMVMFLTEMFRYSYACPAGPSLALQTWLLSRPPEFELGDIGGDLEVLAASTRGPRGPQGVSVAVNGISTCLGGDSKDYLCYWLMFAKAGADTFVEIPLTRWDHEVYCSATDVHTAQVTGTSYTKHQGYVDGIELFDSSFFGISVREASGMDPNQRKILEVVYEALNMGGYDMTALQRTPAHIGCFVGTSGTEWNMTERPQDTAGLGTHEAIMSNRCNFLMNLKGSSQTINTACSAGLVAMHTAKLHLMYRDFDPLAAVVAAGVNLAYSPVSFISASSGAMLSYKGRSFTFDVGADGYGRGEGASSVLMDIAELSPSVFALAAGSQSNQDGRSASITAPNGPSQEQCIRAALREASLGPAEVDCFECHGTGTALGDPIEVGAQRRICGSEAGRRALACTSSKTNLGHLEGGAGMAGFVKCCMQVMRAECGPNIHFREGNPHLNVEGFPCRFVSECLTFAHDSSYTGVSSFGFGGTNAHALAYGRNSATSRGIGQRSLRRVVMDRIRRAPPPDVAMLGSDPEQWESNGMPASEGQIGRVFRVELLEDGSVVWREAAERARALAGSTFHLTGSFNQWGLSMMQPSSGIPNLHVGEVCVPPEGEVLFRVVADGDPLAAYCPPWPRCTRKAAPVVGPGPPPPELHREAAWLIEGRPGQRFRVEFHCSDESTSVLWLRAGDAVSS
ncbi:unnamed protein product [Prorocentrum cordatum]|uniref:Ketosynthase family 3 (KS3) domain-containing protein n=1 Tax=Prorocentrum cordatum TaxID=2364126 RepID=A0ABN9T357_9DINO|nr:unnamed protein product [Polarella glacialis]